MDGWVDVGHGERGEVNLHYIASKIRSSDTLTYIDLAYVGRCFTHIQHGRKGQWECVDSEFVGFLFIIQTLLRKYLCSRLPQIVFLIVVSFHDFYLIIHRSQRVQEGSNSNPWLVRIRITFSLSRSYTISSPCTLGLRALRGYATPWQFLPEKSSPFLFLI